MARIDGIKDPNIHINGIGRIPIFINHASFTTGIPLMSFCLSLFPCVYIIP